MTPTVLTVGRMADERLLDRASDDYRIVAGLIRSAQQEVGATGSQWWNGDIALLPATSRTRSRTDLDGTIHLHPRRVIAPLHRAAAGGHDRWWNPKATRDASYNVIYEALRTSGPTGLSRTTTQPLDRALPADQAGLDRALTEQLTYELAERIMDRNGLGEAYEADPPEAANLGGHGLMSGPLGNAIFRINQLSTTSTAAARGLVDGIAEASGAPRDEVFAALVRSPKPSRLSVGLTTVAEARSPGLVTELAAGGLQLNLTSAERAAGREWARLSSLRSITISTIDKAEQWGYAIGRDTAAVLVAAGNDAADRGSAILEGKPVDLSRPAGARELRPDEILGAQAPPGSTASGSGSASAQRTGAERPDRQVER